MGKVKKTFDTESMYKKIMPSSNLSNLKQDEKSEPTIQKAIRETDNAPLASEQSYAQNLMAFLVREKMKMVMDKMDCCKCEKCTAHIFTQVINQFSPRYVVGTSAQLQEQAQNCDSALGLEVTTVVLREVVLLRQTPLHDSHAND